MVRKGLLITKASGKIVPFDEAKLMRSLKRSGASDEAANSVIEEIENRLYEGISTKKIYQQAFRLLKKFSGASAARYKLKKAIIELGPSGYPFEQFVAEILKSQGYGVKVGQVVEGFCVNHEVDVIAEKDDKRFMIECKFHNKQAYFSDVKVSLYIDSRFRDVVKKWKIQDGAENKFHQGWIVTNTRFSEDGMKYGTCAGLHLVGWDHPSKGSLKDWIDESGLHPVTCMTTLNKREKQLLLEQKIVLSKDIPRNQDILKKIGLTPERINKAVTEAQQLCRLPMK